MAGTYDLLTRAVGFLFIFFCMCPFLFPIPGLPSNLQMYGLLFGVVFLALNAFRAARAVLDNVAFSALLVTLFAALIIAVSSGLTLGAFRALFNHISIFVVIIAAYVLVKQYGFDERFIKAVILVWFAVALVQIVFFRGFLAEFIGSPNWSSSSRGVIGLASEPSFLGISCFYFLHLADKFRTNRALFLALVSFMGVVLAQSAMGIIFIAAFWVMLVFDRCQASTILILGFVSILFVALFFVWASSSDSSSRIVSIVATFMDGGFEGLYLQDESIRNRFNSIVRALSSSFGNYLFPLGMGARIGSGYGGILCELGIFAVVEMVVVSLGMALQFKKQWVRVLYFVVITGLLFSNTQIGNPQLLLVVGMNYALSPHRLERAVLFRSPRGVRRMLETEGVE
ncbi:MAG: hypothetical protein HFJ66_01440 [Eggerthellaceae bacterium]|nr:hypothetical protein [Eggerthellaceae bacterium]